MDVNNLKYVVGEAKENQPAIIRFFGPVNDWNTRDFNDEFLWLQDWVKPSKIIVLINSEGGSVLYGMSTFSVINGCPIEVDCVVEGIAASMGSVLWAAGDNLYMHDYSLLMIHNPFNKVDDGDIDSKNMVEAFRFQLETIYMKRFGLKKDEVQKIMNGEDGADGTYLTAKDAVKAGFISSDHIIKTNKTVCDKVKGQIDGVSDGASLRDIMASVSKEIDENKLLAEVVAIHKQNDNVNQITNQMEQKELLFNTVSAQLGFNEATQVTEASARVAALVKAETDLKDVQAKFDQLTIQYKGKETEVANLQSKLDEVNASLKQYQDAEKAALEAEINATIEAAIKAGKIEDSAKEAWLTMAHSDFATVKATLESIHGRDNITKEIATDPANVQDAKDAVKDVEAKVQAKVKEVVGEFEFKKF